MASNGATNGDTNGDSSRRSSSNSLNGDAPEFVPRLHEHAHHEMGPSYAPGPPQYHGPPAYVHFNGYQFNDPSQYHPAPAFYPGSVNGIYPSPPPPPPPPGPYYPHQAAPWLAANGGPVHFMDPFSRQMGLIEEARMAENAQSYHDDYNNALESTAHQQNPHRKKGKKNKKSKKAKKAAAHGEMEDRNGERAYVGVE